MSYPLDRGAAGWPKPGAEAHPRQGSRVHPDGDDFVKTAFACNARPPGSDVEEEGIATFPPLDTSGDGRVLAPVEDLVW